MKRYLAEFFGTMTLVLMGCGSIVFSNNTISHLEIAICFGLTLIALIYAIGPISGCHVNPSVTIAMLVLKKIKPTDAFGYIISQCLGSILGALLLFIIAKVDLNLNTTELTIGQNMFNQNNGFEYNVFVAFIVEMILTTFFVIVILGTTSQENKAMAGIIIGLTLIVIHIIGIPITGVSVNPARSIGPALFAGGVALNQLWVFITAPICGALIGSGIWTLIEMNKELNKNFNNLIN